MAPILRGGGTRAPICRGRLGSPPVTGPAPARTAPQSRCPTVDFTACVRWGPTPGHADTPGAVRRECLRMWRPGGVVDLLGDGAGDRRVGDQREVLAVLLKADWEHSDAGCRCFPLPLGRAAFPDRLDRLDRPGAARAGASGATSAAISASRRRQVHGTATSNGRLTASVTALCLPTHSRTSCSPALRFNFPHTRDRGDLEQFGQVVPGVMKLIAS